MEKLHILSADFLDILFDGRNKTYGAYELRKTYDKRITYAMTGTFLLCLLFIVGSIMANGKKKNNQIELSTTVELENFKKEDPKIEPPKPLPKQDPPKVEMAKFTPPKIVVDDEVKPEEEIRELEKMEDVKIGTLNTEGTKDDGVIAPPIENKGVNAVAPKSTIDVDEIFTVVQIPARFPGDIDGWRKYLERNLNADLPAENGAPGGSYTVTVSFIVNREGVISDVKAENDPGYGTKTEAIRVIQKGPKWQPAEQNGQKVIYRHRQNVTFRVGEN